MMDDLTRNVLEQRDNIENQRNRELNSNREEYIKQLQKENQLLKKDKKFYSNAFVNLRNRNDKAIEYIETATIDPQSMRHYRSCLLEILKGYNKEE